MCTTINVVSLFLMHHTKHKLHSSNRITSLPLQATYKAEPKTCSENWQLLLLFGAMWIEKDLTCPSKYVPTNQVIKRQTFQNFRAKSSLWICMLILQPEEKYINSSRCANVYFELYLVNILMFFTYHSSLKKSDFDFIVRNVFQI